MMTRREFMRVLAAASVVGAASGRVFSKSADFSAIYDLPRFGNVHLLHFTDCHAQLVPIYFREPSVNLGVSGSRNQVPHLVGESFLRHFGIRPDTPAAHAFTCIDFEAAAQKYGKVGGFAHLSSLVKSIRDSRPGALLLDGGDTWQGSATSLWTKGQDMVDACKLLGVDVMTGHWEFTYGAERVQQIVADDFGDKLSFVAQNVTTNDFGDPVFEPFTLREMNGVPVAIIGQAFPYTPVANPSYLIPDWSFGIQEQNLQATIDQARGQGAKVVVLLSHNGMDVDLKLASRVTGLDAIMGGHTHDGVPQPVLVKNASGQTLVTNAGSNGKFLAVLDFDVKEGKVSAWKYNLLPVFSDALPADPDMQSLIERVRSPYLDKLNEPLAIAGETLYRRGNFNGTFDQLILDALLDVKDAEISFSPGFRWGTSLLAGDTIRMEHLMDQTAITYPYSTLTEMKGSMVKTILEDVADNLFNADPYYQQGGDMVRVGGLDYTIDPNAPSGDRIKDMALKGKAIDAEKTYKVAGWAPVASGASGEPIWDVVSGWLKAQKTLTPRELKKPNIVGMQDNQGII
ncbi:MAG: thiosulfohydrolase SoxB [Lysobacteraceae bacterium]